MSKIKLAFFGGKKSITFKKPHWKWPPLSKSKIDSILNILKSADLILSIKVYYQKIKMIKLFH